VKRRKVWKRIDRERAVRAFIAAGKSVSEAARQTEIPRVTISQWKARHPEWWEKVCAEALESRTPAPYAARDIPAQRTTPVAAPRAASVMSAAIDSPETKRARRLDILQSELNSLRRSIDSRISNGIHVWPEEFTRCQALWGAIEALKDAPLA